METKKLLALLFEHVEAGDIYSFDVSRTHVNIWLDPIRKKSIYLYESDVLKQYNEIFKEING